MLRSNSQCLSSLPSHSVQFNVRGIQEKRVLYQDSHGHGYVLEADTFVLTEPAQPTTELDEGPENLGLWTYTPCHIVTSLAMPCAPYEWGQASPVRCNCCQIHRSFEAERAGSAWLAIQSIIPKFPLYFFSLLPIPLKSGSLHLWQTLYLTC